MAIGTKGLRNNCDCPDESTAIASNLGERSTIARRKHYDIGDSTAKQQNYDSDDEQRLYCERTAVVIQITAIIRFTTTSAYPT